MNIGRISLTIPLKPWFQDHCFRGRSVLPAVETMLLLAAKVHELYPESETRIMEDVRFAKFLEIPPDTETLPVFVECEATSDGRIKAILLSRIQWKKMSRIKEHGEVFFAPANSLNEIAQPLPVLEPAPQGDQLTEVATEYLYRKLVPFGPNYQTLQETLLLSRHEAWGKLKAPDLPLDAFHEHIGSPFPLDGALHAACVLGQQVVDFVPFPVGFDRRVIFRPTRPGCRYLTKAELLRRTHDELIFNLVIYDKDDRVFETISGVRMRDVSGAMKK